MKKYLKFSFLVIAVFVLICGNQLFAQITFTQPTNNLGLTNPGGLMGCAWGDYDSDGDMDFIICGGPSTLYRNDVNTTGGFTQVSRTTTTPEPGKIFYDVGGVGTNAALWADLNNDNKLDLIVGMLRIYLNEADTLAYKANLITTADANGGWGMTVGDYDRDGDLDIACAVGTGTNSIGKIRLFKNDGAGNFTDVASDLALDIFSYEAWNPQFIDFNNDQCVDLWMPDIRTSEPCAFFKNTPEAELQYYALEESGITALSSIVNSWGDFNNDGYVDLWLHPLVGDDAVNGANKLFQNNGDGTFTDIAPSLGMDSTHANNNQAPRGSSWGDFDNDGDLDLLVGVRSGIGQQLWSNNGDGTFAQIGANVGLGTIIGSDMRSATFVDYDNDGFLDIYMMQNSTTPPFLLHNSADNGNKFLGIKLKGVTNNRIGIGARVVVKAGDLMLTQFVGAGDASNSSTVAHFGLGSKTGVDSIIVYWPNGVITRSANIPAGKYYACDEVAGVQINGVEEEQIPTEFELAQNFPNPFNPETTIQFTLPQTSNVRIVLYDVLGNVVKEIANGNYFAGQHQVKLNASNLASGIYFYKLEAGNFSTAKKLMLLK